MFNQQTRHVLDYLLLAENRETDPWLQEDVRQAWICLRFAARGYPNPFVISSYVMYGVHPAKLQAQIEARRRAMCGTLYEEMFPAPKKPVQSERNQGWRKAA